MIGTARLAAALCAAVIAFALLCAPSGPALAHRLNVFAAFDGTRIAGEAYFTGGARAGGIVVRALGTDGRPVAEARTDAAGAFAFPPLAPADLDIVADAGDGHVARWRIAAAEMGGTAPAAGQPTRGALPAGAAPEGDAAAPAGLEQAVDRAVARRIAPLQRQLAEYEAKVRLHDVLGGLGYLVGIAGLAVWWLARREGRAR